MKRALVFTVLAFLVFSAQAHNVGRGSSRGASSAGQSGQGGRYTLGDEYSAWPQAEMQQYAKPHFESYKGDKDGK